MAYEIKHGSMYAIIFAGHMQYLVEHYDEIRPDTELLLAELYYSPIRHYDIIYKIAKKLQRRMPELKTWPAWNFAMQRLKEINSPNFDQWV